MGGAAFFAPGPQGRLDPSPEARSPWSPDMLHGRLLAALAARAIETEQMPAGFRPVRLTVDLFRAAPMEAVTLSSGTVRGGRRVTTAEVRITCAGHEVARASAVMLRAGAATAGGVWSPHHWEGPPPEDMPAPPRAETGRFPLELRAVGALPFGHVGPKRVWVREVMDLVEGEATSPFARLAGAADLANPMANSGPGGLEFINADLNLHMARLPIDEWVGLDVSVHVDDDGVAVGGCDLYDRRGPLGTATVASVANAALVGPAGESPAGTD